MTRYPSDRLHEEVAYLSYHFHWPYQQVMQLDHRERQRWVAEVARINERLNEDRGATAMTSTGVPLGLSWCRRPAANWVPGVRPLEPFLAFNFAVEIEGLLVGGFSEVSGLESTIEVEEYREGGVNGFVHKLPGATTHANLVLRHGLTAIEHAVELVRRHDARRDLPPQRHDHAARSPPDPGDVVELPQRVAGPVVRTGVERKQRRGRRSRRSSWSTRASRKPLLGQAAALAHGGAQMAGR